MAERESRTRRSGDRRRPAASQRRRHSDRGIDARHAATAAARYVLQMTGKQPQGLTSMERTEDGWRVGVEVLESRRIPDSTDILALYRVDLDQDGELLSYDRERRYHRGQVDGEVP